MPLFSVVIPTRNRHETLPHAVSSVLQQGFPDFEIIVHDNSSNNDSAEAVALFRDKRLHYYRTDQTLAMYDNWEAALGRTSGDYVIFIGDDDGLLPSSLEILANAFSRFGRPSHVAWPHHRYSWPNHTDPRQQNLVQVEYEAMTQTGLAAQLARFENVPYIRPGDIERIPNQRFFAWVNGRFALRAHYSWYTPAIYAAIYHGCVSRSLIDQARERQGGRYFLDQQPDHSSIVSNLYFCSSHFLFSGIPLTVDGHSGKSNGAATRDQVNELAQLEKFASEAQRPLSSLNPPFIPEYVGLLGLILGTYEAMKAALFPADKELETDFGRFLEAAASWTINELQSTRSTICERILALADRHGVSRDRLNFPNGPNFKRLSGPSGTTNFIDGWRLHLQNMTDATRLIDAMMPVASGLIR